MRPEEKLFDAVTGIDEEIVDSAQTSWAAGASFFTFF